MSYLDLCLPVLAIEDCDADFLLLERALRKAAEALAVRLEVSRRQSVEDWQKAPPEGCASSVIFLDVNLPGQSGLSYLATLRHAGGQAGAPHLVLVSSLPKDVLEPEGLTEVSFLHKSLAHEEFCEGVKSALSRALEGLASCASRALAGLSPEPAEG